MASAVRKVKKEIPEMKKTGFCVLMAACVLLLASCSGLNESAQNVKYSTKRVRLQKIARK